MDDSDGAALAAWIAPEPAADLPRRRAFPMGLLGFQLRRAWMFPPRLRCLAVILALTGASTGIARAQSEGGDENFLHRLNPFRPYDPTRPVTVTELGKRLDHLGDQIRNDGLIVVKQPDVFSPARMTRFRSDFEREMAGDLTTFALVLAARVNRLDSATTTQSTSLSAALSKPGTASVNYPAAPTIPSFGAGASLDPKTTAFGSVALATASSTNPMGFIGLGVEGTVYLDEKKRFLDHLNQIRRISLGPDQNDSSGYGLYLIRLPASITPGECTVQGYGADLTVSLEHEFPPEFLPTTFRNLVVNDVVDQLGPFIYDLLRSGADELIENLIDAEKRKTTDRANWLLSIDANLAKLAASWASEAKPKVDIKARARGTAPTLGDYEKSFDPIVNALVAYILRRSPTLQSQVGNDPDVAAAIARRLKAMIDARRQFKSGIPVLDQGVDSGLNDLEARLPTIGAGGALSKADVDFITSNVRNLILSYLAGPGRSILGPVPPNFGVSDLNASMFIPFVQELYSSALPDDINILDTLLGTKSPDLSTASISKSLEKLLNLNLVSTRNPKQIYPIAPRELIYYLGLENTSWLAEDAQAALITKQVRSNDIRSYLRQTLFNAYRAMDHSPRPDSGVPPPLADTEFMNRLLLAIKERQFGEEIGAPSPLQTLNDELINKLEATHHNIKGKPIAALCWAIALDAALLDDSLRNDVRKVFAVKGLPCEHVDSVRFYIPREVPNDQAMGIFNEYVEARWPIITFALDPVTDQQNIADSFTLNRDLQLALSYAFATGQISFSQLTTFRRQLQQSSDTIALNRTVTAYAHSNDIFGYRFTPRFQNPPNQRTNIGVITSQLIGGGPGPDYQTKKSKLESGQRELTAVVLLPTFLPTLRMNFTSNWFKLTDPEHLVFHTNHMLEMGRRVQELRQSFLDAGSAAHYRDADIRNLQSKLGQLEAMLPMQSRVVQLPFENTASGFELFSEGATALVPELSGFEGVDVVQEGKTAEVFLFGKYFSIVDTKVIVGGKILSPPPPGPSILTAGTTTTPTVNQVDILSREVIHVQIPPDALPTTTADDDPPQQYIEIHVATPNGISNRVFVPFQPKSPPVPNGYNLAADSQELDVYYQWLTGDDTKLKLAATSDPGAADKKPLKIAWDDATGMAPKTLQTRFTATVSGATLNFYLKADSGVNDEYGVDRQLLTVCLLKRLQEIVPAQGMLPDSISMDVSVQPYLPQDSMGYRVSTKERKLPNPLTVKFLYYANGTDALKSVTCPPEPAPAAKAAAGAPHARLRPRTDGSVIPVSSPAPNPLPPLPQQGLQLPPQGSISLPPLPQVPPIPNGNLNAGNSAISESGLVARMLTGQPLPANLAASNLTAAAQTVQANLASTVTPPTSATGPNSPVVVMPAPVVVVAPQIPPETPHKSRLHSMLFGKKKGPATPAQAPK
jgi:hypothetical protein